mgnify:FL=1
MITKPELFSAWLAKSQEIADSLNLPLSYFGTDTVTGSSFVPDADKPYLKATVIYGEETAPYLNGLDGQRYTAILQIDAIYPKHLVFAAIDTALSIKDAIPLDSKVGAIVRNVSTSPVMYDE